MSGRKSFIPVLKTRVAVVDTGKKQPAPEDMPAGPHSQTAASTVQAAPDQSEIHGSPQAPLPESLKPALSAYSPATIMPNPAADSSDGFSFIEHPFSLVAGVMPVDMQRRPSGATLASVQHEVVSSRTAYAAKVLAR